MAVEGEILCPIREIEWSIEVVFPHLINDDIHVELCVRTFLPHQLVKRRIVTKRLLREIAIHDKILLNASFSTIYYARLD